MTVTPPLLVGRDRELTALRAHLTAALGGRGGLVLMGGEAGIGKTALAEALLREAAERCALVLVGRCYDLTETPPYGPWIEAFELLSREHDGVPLPAPLGGGDPAASQAALFAQVRDTLAAAARAQPLLLLLDDLHWADPASLDLLRVVARQCGALSLLLLATYREEAVTASHPLYQLLPLLTREARAARLELRPLGEADTLALVRASYHLPAADEARLVAHLQAHAEGNPLYLGELLRGLAEAGLLRAEGDGATLGDLGRAGLPTFLRQVIGARVARLGEAARHLLSVAAVIGQEVPLELWATVAGVEEEALLAVAERAVEARILEETPDGDGVRFAHALIREALYAALLPLRRRGWHRRVGEALAALPNPDPDAVAYHFQQAVDARASEWLLRAADRALRTYAWLSAAERVEAALALLGEQGGDAVELGWLCVRLARLRRHGDPRQALTYAERAVQLAAEGGDPALAAYALKHRGLLRPRVPDLRGGLADLAAAVAAQEALAPDDRARLVAKRAAFGEPLDATNDLGELAVWLTAAGRFTEAVALVERFMAQHRIAQGGFGFELGRACAYLGRPDEARQWFTEGRAQSEAEGRLFLVGQMAFHELLHVQLPYFADQPGERARLAREGERGWRRASGALGAEASPELAHLPLMALDGRWAEARALALAMHAAAGVNAPIVLVLLGPLALARGEAGLAWELVHQTLPDGPTTEPGGTQFETATTLQRVAALLALEAGDLAAARAWLEAHDRWLGWSGAVLGRAEGALGWAAYHRAAGDLAAARRHAEQALAHATVPRQPLALLAAHRLLGELDTVARREADAAAHLAEALALAEACAVPYERALTLLALAELRHATGDRVAAATLLGDARALLLPLEARPALARADALEAGLAASPAGAPAYPGGLTAREVEVLRLVAQGLSDAQVAERLFVSLPTVRTHLRSIYAKLDVPSRTAAARFAAEHGLT